MVADRARFTPDMRFHHGRDYGRVMNRQQKAAGAHLVALISPQRRGGSVPRLGIMVSTKVAKLAVRRHQLKRWVRECFRTRLIKELAGHDLVILFRRDPPEDGHAIIDTELLRLVPKALTARAEPRGRGGQARR